MSQRSGSDKIPKANRTMKKEASRILPFGFRSSSDSQISFSSSISLITKRYVWDFEELWERSLLGTILSSLLLWSFSALMLVSMLSGVRFCSNRCIFLALFGFELWFWWIFFVFVFIVGISWFSQWSLVQGESPEI